MDAPFLQVGQIGPGYRLRLASRILDAAAWLKDAQSSKKPLGIEITEEGCIRIVSASLLDALKSRLVDSDVSEVTEVRRRLFQARLFDDGKLVLPAPAAFLAFGATADQQIAVLLECHPDYIDVVSRELGLARSQRSPESFEFD